MELTQRRREPQFSTLSKFGKRLKEAIEKRQTARLFVAFGYSRDAEQECAAFTSERVESSSCSPCRRFWTRSTCRRCSQATEALHFLMDAVSGAQPASAEWLGAAACGLLGGLFVDGMEFYHAVRKMTAGCQRCSHGCGTTWWKRFEC